jgi:uncharacterized protein YbjT (DUF2867 family)
MYVVLGASGRVGGATAAALLAAGEPVRAVVRQAGRAQELVRLGATETLADFDDVPALTRAVAGAQGVFVMIPPYFDPSPDFAEARAVIDALVKALGEAKPGRLAVLSSVGAHRPTGLGLISQLHLLEEALGGLDTPTTFVRAAWFMENMAWDLAPARRDGVIDSYLAPLDRAIPMVATADIGRAAAEVLRQDRPGKRIVEIEGPRPYAPLDVAKTLSCVLDRPVAVRLVPRRSWRELFTAQGMIDPGPREEMLDGFHSGWISFEGGEAEHRRGETSLETVARGLAAAENA